VQKVSKIIFPRNSAEFSAENHFPRIKMYENLPLQLFGYNLVHVTYKDEKLAENFLAEKEVH
jgi:hypothetical protein